MAGGLFPRSPKSKSREVEPEGVILKGYCGKTARVETKRLCKIAQGECARPCRARTLRGYLSFWEHVQKGLVDGVL